MPCNKKVLFLLLFVFSISAKSQDIVQKQKVFSPERAFLERFGQAAVIDGNYALLNSSRNITNAEYKDTIIGAGAVFCYKYDGSNWVLHQKIVEENRAAGNTFGSDVKLSKRTAAISSRNKIHILKLNNQDSWVFHETIGIDSIFKGYFIEDFSVNANKHLVVGVHKNFRNDTSILSVFEPDILQPDSWKISFQDTVKNILKVGNNNYGHTAVISSTSSQIAYKVPGDSFDGSGFNLAIHVYQKKSSWRKSQILRRPNQTFDFFGAGKDITMNDSFIFEGHSVNNLDKNEANFISRAGAVYIYKNNNGNYQFFQKITAKRRSLTQFFGFKVATEGNFLLVGAAFEHYDKENKDSMYGAGAAFLFELKDCQWEEVVKITPDDRIKRHGFAWSLDFSNNKIVAGSNDSRDPNGQNILTSAGAVYFFEFKPDSNSNVDTVFVCDTFTSPSGRNKWHESGLYLDVVKDSKGCDSSILVQLFQMKIDSGKFSVSPLSQCFSDNEISLFDSSSIANVDTALWVFPDGSTSLPPNINYGFASPGEKRIYRLRSNPYCKDTSIMTIQIWEDPSINVYVTPKDTQCLDSNLFILESSVNSGTSPYIYKWEMNGINYSSNNIEQSFSREGEFRYKLIVTDSNGCTDTFNNSVWVENCPEQFLFKIKSFNTFTPNDDGYNDVLDFPIENEVFYDLRIFNRNGTQVFSSDDSNKDWNGKINNTGAALAEGTYFYRLDYQGSGNSIETKYGVITLMR
jgi:gliding motility-associated-like protein